MSLIQKYNPISGNFDFVNSDTGSGNSIWGYVANYAALPLGVAPSDPGIGDLVGANTSQGVYFINYRSDGFYKRVALTGVAATDYGTKPFASFSNAADQATVDAGTNGDEYVSAVTLTNSTVVTNKELLVNKDTDGTLAANSDIKYASQKATKTYADTKVAANAAIVGATKTKITYDNKGLVTAGTDATTSDINDSLNKRYVTDANLVVIGNTSGTNTGDQTNISGNAATVTTNADLTGVVTSVGNATAIANAAITNAMLANGAVANLSGTNTGDNAVNSLYSGLVSNATHTGDATGATALTLATVNSDIGAFTNANITVNAKGLITAASSGSGSSGVVGTLNVNTTAVGNIGIGEDDLITYSVGANTLATNGDYITFEGSGSFGGSINSKRLRIKFGSTTIFDSGSLAVTVASEWVTEGTIIRTGATTFKADVRLNSSFASLSAYAEYSTGTETLANALTLKHTGEATANDDIIQEFQIVRVNSLTTDALLGYAPIASPTFTGTVTIPTLTLSNDLTVANGGTGASSLTGVVIGDGTNAMTAVAGTANQILRRNAGNTAYEFATISSGGVSEITATATFDFLSEEDAAVNTVASALLTTANFKSFSVIPQETTATSLDDFKLNGVSFNIENIIDNTSFDIRGNALNGASGIYTIIYKTTYQ